MRKRGVAMAISVAAAMLSACGSTTPAASPRTLLTEAKATIDATQEFHFTLTTSGASGGSGTTIVGGEGDLGRPDKLVGSFTVRLDGLQATVKVAAGNGKFYAELPFTSSFTPTDPATFGVANPAKLISPDGGLSSILSDAQAIQSGGQTRLNGVLYDVVTGTVPGQDITVLPDKDPSVPVGLKALIDPSNHQLHQVTLTGPIETTTSSSFTVTLTNYGEHVDLALPST